MSQLSALRVARPAARALAEKLPQAVVAAVLPGRLHLGTPLLGI